jgi:hypothetical protein
LTTRPLTNREKVFVQAYLSTWNASAAAREAKYKDFGKAGRNLLKHPEIQAAISEAMKNDGMPTEEVVDRLSQQARLNTADFMLFADVQAGHLDHDGEPIFIRQYVGINWVMVEKYGYLVKGIKYTKQGTPYLEFHDPQRALEMIGRAQGLFVDRTDLNVKVDSVTVKVIKGVSVDEL